MKFKFLKKILSSLLGASSLCSGNMGAIKMKKRKPYSKVRLSISRNRKVPKKNSRTLPKVVYGVGGTIATVATGYLIYKSCICSGFASESESEGTKINTEEEMKIDSWAGGFNVIPWANNNCWASVALCWLSDPRDIEHYAEKLDKNNFRENKFKNLFNKIIDSKSNPEKKKAILKSLSENCEIQRMFLQNKQDHNVGNLGDQRDIGEGIGVVSTEPFHFPNFDNYSNAQKMKSKTFKIKESKEFAKEIVDYVKINRSADCERQLEIKPVRDFLGCVGDGVSKKIVNKRIISHCDPFGKLAIEGRDYLVSEIAVKSGPMNGGHWYEDVIVYDKNSLNEDEPKIKAIIRLNNGHKSKSGVPEPEVLYSDTESFKHELDNILECGELLRYRNLNADDRSVYAI